MDSLNRHWDVARPAIYALVISAGVWFVFRCLVVVGADGQTPFLSANDRSRWCTIVSLVEDGTYAIDRIIQKKGWNTIDKVYHRAADGVPHYYSSKPVLFPTLMAAPYAVLHQLTGLRLSERPFLVGRALLLLINGVCLWFFFSAMIQLTRRYTRTRWGAVFVVSAITWGTFLTTFAVTINNHLPAAAAIAVATNAILRIWLDGRDENWQFLVAGFASALAVTFELPALAFLAVVGFAFLLAWPRKTILFFMPPAVILAAGFFGTNWLAHDTLVPAYAHRTAGETWETGNWYHYPGSYWLKENRKGVDRGEQSRARYALHVTLGHHGIWSLTPIWWLSVWGLFHWPKRLGGLAFAELTLGMTVIVLVFYIVLRDAGDRNYGGVTSAFRWAFWLIPLFIVALMPVADAISKKSWALRVLAIALLVFSACSAAYGSFHPFQHPWAFWSA